MFDPSGFQTSTDLKNDALSAVPPEVAKVANIQSIGNEKPSIISSESNAGTNDVQVGDDDEDVDDGDGNDNKEEDENDRETSEERGVDAGTSFPLRPLHPSQSSTQLDETSNNTTGVDNNKSHRRTTDQLKYLIGTIQSKLAGTFQTPETLEDRITDADKGLKIYNYVLVVVFTVSLFVFVWLWVRNDELFTQCVPGFLGIGVIFMAYNSIIIARAFGQSMLMSTIRITTSIVSFVLITVSATGIFNLIANCGTAVDPVSLQLCNEPSGNYTILWLEGIFFAAYLILIIIWLGLDGGWLMRLLQDKSLRDTGRIDQETDLHLLYQPNPEHSL